MAIITVFSADFCREDELIRCLVEKTTFRHTSIEQIISESSVLSGMKESKIQKALTLKTSVFEKFTHEKKYSLAYIKLVLSKILMISAGRDLILSGYPVRLIPLEITHFFQVGLIADMAFRTASLIRKHGGTESEACQKIRKLDEEQAQWLAKYCGIYNAFNPANFDMVIPMHTESLKESCDLVIQSLDEDIFKPTKMSTQAVRDFSLTARVEVALAKKGHDVTVNADNGSICIGIDKGVRKINRLKEEIRSATEQVNGVENVDFEIDSHSPANELYRKYDKNQPSKVLLVDDEQEFVKTLSERLALRDMGSAVVHDGESALHLIEQDEPDVMVFDLKMPGQSGIDVLEQVKENYPDIEVIILTGHGSDDDKKQCLELGAFDYLQKPLDISKLSAVIKKANEKVRSIKSHD